MSQWRNIGVELVRALGVLALVFLCFAHQPAALARASFTLAAFDNGIDCGAPTQKHNSAHAPCHACRLFNGLDLPPAPCTIEPAFIAFSKIVHDPASPPITVAAWLKSAHPRGPPQA